ncbi:MAG: pyridoxamine 5'-phosphate oxidase family protein [Janthinobacterium lividum]
MALDPRSLPAAALEFLAERHLATMTTLRADGSPHVVAVGFTFDATSATVRVITSGTSRKVAHVRRGSRVVLAQVDGRRWLALEGTGEVHADPEEVTEAERRYAQRYRTPRANRQRVVVMFRVDRVLGSVPPWPDPPRPPAPGVG